MSHCTHQADKQMPAILPPAVLLCGCTAVAIRCLSSWRSCGTDCYRRCSRIPTERSYFL